MTEVPGMRPMRSFRDVHHRLTLVYATLSPEDEKRGADFREVRNACQLGLREAAARLGISAVELGECERGVRRFDLAEALALLATAREGEDG